jgi:hypothetical protein
MGKRSIGTPRIFLWRGGADPEAIYKLCLILKKYVMKIIRKFPS